MNINSIPLEPIIACANSYTPDGLSSYKDKLGILLGNYSGGSDRSKSILNYDGVPLQLCISAIRDEFRVHLIGDPHTDLSAIKRFEASLVSAYELLIISKSEELKPLLATTFKHTLPDTHSERAALRFGALWLASQICGNAGMAVYTYLEWGEQDSNRRWQKVKEWLSAILPSDLFYPNQLARIERHCEPIAAAVEGRTLADGEVKVYFRRRKIIPLNKLGFAELEDPYTLHFINQIIQGRTIPETGVVFSLGFSIATGESGFIKTDVCGHCTPRPVQAWEKVILELCKSTGVKPIHIGEELSKGDIEVAFIGMGRNTAGDYRLNLYLKYKVSKDLNQTRNP